ncbi:circumsporozoite protein-like isoform X2 [Simochromis diagramma]|uniref:circumsporozoite protein-like isoform X2 n=1 Tax=Simochromis diagramma TaxID=43689 RepID=UPI001A7ECF84|nr:circumsporozoite protein-like isoform X2 [Simochromis diagramma]
MDNLAQIAGQKAGSLVEGAVKGALNSANKNKGEKKGGGGIFSMFGGNKNKNKDKDDKGAPLPNVPNKDGSGGKKPVPEGNLAGTTGGNVGPTMGGGAGGNVGPTMGGGAGGSGGSAGPVGQEGVTTDRDLMDDLFELGDEMKGN